MPATLLDRSITIHMRRKLQVGEEDAVRPPPDRSPDGAWQQGGTFRRWKTRLRLPRPIPMCPRA